MQNTELDVFSTLVSHPVRFIDANKHRYTETDRLQSDETDEEIQELTKQSTKALDLEKRVKHVIETLQLNLEDSTNEIPAYFGFLKFVYANDADRNDRLSSFIHLATKSRPWTVANLIEAYHLPTPDFILSIQTGNNHNLLKEKSGIQVETEHAIQRGLSATAMITHPWITTSCINQDMIRLVGNALHSDMCGVDVPCISFCNWKYVADHQQLEKNSVVTSTLHDTRFAFDDEDNRRRSIHEYQLITKRNYENRNSGWHLDPNHTHFLLFDDGTNDVKNVLLKRQEIEHEFSISRALKSPVGGYQPKHTRFDNDIPIVMLLLGGDFTTLTAICKSLENGTPLVVARDTGGLADIITQLCRKLSPIDELAEFRKITYIEECKIELKRLCYKEGILTERDDEIKIEDQISEIEKYINVLNEMETLIVVYDAIEHKGNLENAISSAMLKGIKYQVENYEQLLSSETRAAELVWCLIWNKDDYARQLLIDRKDQTIISTNDMYPKKDQINTLTQQLLFEALYRNNVLFVSLLMEHGASIEDLTDEQFIIICIKTMNNNALPLDPIPIDMFSQKRIININDLTQYVERTYNNYLQQYLGHYENERKKNQARHQRLSTRNRKQDISSSYTPISEIFNERKIEALYLWFIFMNQPNMAKYLCSRSRNQTVATLLAAEIYSEAIKKDTKNKKDLNIIAQEFDRHSRGIIDKCFAKDDNFALKLLKSKATTFYNCYPLDVARRADCRIFLASNTIQKHLHDKWYHHFDHQRRFMKMSSSIWICLVSLILPMIPIASVLFPCLYRKSSSNSKPQQETSNLYRSTVTYQSLPEKDENIGSNTPSVRDRIKWFYEAPVVHFYYNFIFFVSFLTLFSYVLLVDYFPLNIYGEKRSGIENLPIPITEIILHICIGSLIIDELSQFILQTTKKYHYSTNPWNWMDLAGILFYLIAFITRWFVIESVFICSKIFMSIDLVIWYIRILYLFAAYEVLGPKLTMIYEMMKDALLIFLCFILIILFGFSIASWSLLTTSQQVVWSNTTNDTDIKVTVLSEDTGKLWRWQVLRDVFNWGIWKVFGQVAEPYNDAVSENDAYGTFVFIFAIGFTVISNVLLLNVLIAMFNEKILRVQEKSNELWRYQRFWLIYEYKDKTILPPPFNILCYIIQAIEYIVCCKCHPKSSISLNQYIKELSEQNPTIRNTTEPSLVDTRQMNREKVFGEAYWEQIFEEEKQEKMLNQKKSDETSEILQTDDYQKLNGTLQSLEKLDFSDKQIGHKGAEQLADAIRKNTTLTQLDLSKNHIGNLGVQYLSDAFLHNKTIITLDLTNNDIGAQGTQYLANAFRNNKTLVEIDLSKNHIGNEGAEHIADAFQHNTTLTTLKLQANRITNYGAECLADTLRKNTTITMLDLRWNKISAKGTQQLADALAHNTTLTFLDLSWNEIDNKGVESLADTLQNNKTLTTLNLASNRIEGQGAQRLIASRQNYMIPTILNLSSNQIGSDGAKHVADALQNNKAITTLDLSSNRIGDDGLKHLIDALQNNSTLITLNLSSNQISQTGIKYLTDAIEHITTLTTLDLNYNEIGAGGAKDLAAILLTNTTLTTLLLSSNQIGPAGMQYFSYALQNNMTITTIDLSKNQIADEGIKHVANALKYNTTHTTLNLEHCSIGRTETRILAVVLRLNTTLTTLNLRDNKISSESAQYLAEALRTCTTLTTLELGGNEIGVEGVQHLADAIKHNKTLNTLDLGSNGINAEGAKHLAGAFQNNKTLSSLDLRSNRIGSEGTRYLADAFRSNETLITLDLTGNAIGAEGAQYLAEAFHNNKTITTIYLGMNGIGVDGAKHLANAFGNDMALSTLDLRGNEISAEGTRYLADAFRNNKTLTILDLRSNGIGDKGPQYLADAFHGNTTLTKLHLGSNGIRAKGSRSLIDAFRYNTTLTTFDLSDNRISVEGVKYLADAFRDNKTLTTLNLSNTKIGSEGVQYLADTFLNNTTLTELDLSSNKMDFDGIQHLADALRNNTTLTILNLSDNKIGDQGIHYLVDAFRENTTLTTLDLSDNEISADEAQYMANAFEDNKIQTLDTQSPATTDVLIGVPEAVADALQRTKSITTLRLRDLKIDPKGSQRLAVALQNNKTLTTLDLTSNIIGAEGTQYLADAFRNNTTLTTLDLTLNAIGVEGIRSLADIFRNNTTLTTLNLRSNGIGTEGARYLADAFRNNKTFTTIDLQSIEIGDKGVQYLAEAFKDNNTLTTLNLSDNAISAEGAQYLADAFQNNTTLINLDLSYNAIGAIGTQYLSNAFQNNTTLTSLHLGSNEIGVEGAQYLANILRDNETFTTLHLRLNAIGDKGIQYLADSLRNNKTLTTLDVADNAIGDKGVQHLADAFRNNEVLTILHLENNYIGKRSKRRVIQTLRQNTGLKLFL
ncbi:unnamed protein product [Adineta steineri]|uniref:Ion transport domain-containing protein n=1 Tax=Adineta steineri TaxID=433720 RepID=A0A814INY6_9BILA|nr:unnamed protein product [Adineta steineri]